ncbi:IMPACT family protein [Methylotetracoccus oryzae]|uniref:IMPACT family protein n=1 Tax=Methylotetracoccus oryzae TaxID=1919059 RepID=UPI001118C265|nr:YigZ family protein [Methylotetracoccus oryzae]
MSYLTLAAPAEHRDDVKGSIFLAFAARADATEAALQYLGGLAARYPDASHLCWAYRIGQGYRFSDAGEPSGTAGQPIYRAIEGQGLDHVVVGVVRYFGGTKLGAGGLVRAYGGAAAEVLRQAPKHTEWPRRAVEIHVPFAHLGSLYHLLDALCAQERQESFDAAGVCLRARVAEDDLDRLAEALRSATRDDFKLTVAEPA